MRLAVILTEGFADWEAALLMASARAHLGIEVLACDARPEPAPLRSMGGLAVTPELGRAAIPALAPDALVLVGGSAWEGPGAPEIGELIIEQRAAGRVVAGICAATLAMARVGLLDTVPHTSNGADFLAATGYAGASLYRDVPHAIGSDGIVTAPGTAPVSFAVEVLRALGRGGPELEGFAALFGAEHRSGGA